MKARWPEVDEKGQWAIEALEEQLLAESRTAEELLGRAVELRAQAATLEIPAMRETALLMAERYEEVAAARASASR